jgi:hypothetical protein
MSIYDHLEFKHSKYIVEIAKGGTSAAAAIRLPLAQSALSRQISEMEDALGIQKQSVQVASPVLRLLAATTSGSSRRTSTSCW